MMRHFPFSFLSFQWSVLALGGLWLVSCNEAGIRDNVTDPNAENYAPLANQSSESNSSETSSSSEAASNSSETPSSGEVASSSSKLSSSGKVASSSSKLSSSSEVASSSSAISSSSAAVSSSTNVSSSANVNCTNTTYGTNTVTDCRDGKTYKTVVIGTQTWMASDLAYLPSVNGNKDTSSTIAKYYVYDYDGTSVADAKAKSNYTTYGVLYNWPAVMSNVCPYGWHVPNDAEMTTLINYAGGSAVAGKALKAMNTAWTQVYGEDTYGFHAMPGGRHYESSFANLGESSYLWTSTMYNNSLAISRYMFYMSPEISAHNVDKFIGYSVRCLKN